jgi:hypothetical protein
MRLALVPDPWPQGAVCRRRGCARPALAPHGYCNACELSHLAALRRRSVELAVLAVAVAARAPELYDAMSCEHAEGVLAHIAAHVHAADGQISQLEVLAGFNDYVLEVAERALRRRGVRR